MTDLAVFPLNVDHPDVPQPAVVGRLPAALGVENGVVEDGVGAAVGLADNEHLDRKASEVGVALVSGNRAHSPRW